MWVWVGCGTGGVILIFFCIIVCIYCRRTKRSKSKAKNLSQRQIVEGIVLNSQDNIPNSFLNTALVSDDIEVAPKSHSQPQEPQPLKLKEKFSNSKPYGGIGESAVKPFISIQAHNKRLASITTVSSSSSSSSIAQELRCGSSPIIGIERRDSGYVDVNLPTKAQLEARRSSEMISRKALLSVVKKPSIPNEHLKQRRTSNLSNCVTIPVKPEPQLQRSSELQNKKIGPMVAKKPVIKNEHLQQRRTSNVKSSETEPENNGYLVPVISSKQRAKSEAVADHTNENEMAIFRHATTGQAIDYCRKAQRMLSQKNRFEVNNNSEYEPSNNYEGSRRPSNYENTRRPSNYENARRPSNYEEIKERNNYEKAAQRPSEYETAVIVTSQSDVSISSSSHDYTDADVFERDSDYTLPNQHGNQIPNQSMYHLPYHETKGNSGYETPQEISPQFNQEHYLNLNARAVGDYQNFDYSVPVANPTSVDGESIYLEFLPESSTSDTAR